MRDQVKFWIGLQDISAYDETQFISDLLYQGTLDLLARTKCVVRCVDLHVVSGQDEYYLDKGILALVDVEDGARDKARRSQCYDPSFTLIRSDILRVQPVPDADADVQTWGVLRPTQM